MGVDAHDGSWRREDLDINKAISSNLLAHLSSEIRDRLFDGLFVVQRGEQQLRERAAQ